MEKHTRRKFITTVSAVVATTLIPSPSAPSGRYGFLDVPGCARRGLSACHAKVYLDGVDVTHTVQAFDDSQGWVEGFKQYPSKTGYSYRLDGHGSLIRERRYGHVYAVVPKVSELGPT